MTLVLRLGRSAARLRPAGSGEAGALGACGSMGAPAAGPVPPAGGRKDAFGIMACVGGMTGAGGASLASKDPAGNGADMPPVVEGMLGINGAPGIRRDWAGWEELPNPLVAAGGRAVSCEGRPRPIPAPGGAQPGCVAIGALMGAWPGARRGGRLVPRAGRPAGAASLPKPPSTEEPKPVPAWELGS